MWSRLLGQFVFVKTGNKSNEFHPTLRLFAFAMAVTKFKKYEWEIAANTKVIQL